MVQRDVDFVILFEKAVRELDVACAIRVLLERRGLTVEIIQQDHPEADVVRGRRPSVVVLPFCYQARSNNSFLVEWRDATFFNLTWEQLFYPGNASAKTPRGEFAVRHVIHNAWSEAYADLLRAQGVPEEHIFVSGNPAYTLYDPPYRSYFLPRAELARAHGLDATATWVFFPENYNWAFYDDRMLKQMVSDGQPPAQVAEMRRAVRRSFEEAMRWCRQVAELPRVNLILRPRPATPADEFRRRVEEVIGKTPSRMLVIPTETVRDWIVASDVVTSSSSTSLIEASVAGKPAYIIEPVEWPASLRQVWHDLVPRIRSATEFLDIASGARSPATAPALAAWARSSLMANGDAIELIAERLAAVRRREVVVPAPAPWRSLVTTGRYGLSPRLTLELRRRLRPLRFRANPIEAEFRPDVAAVTEIPSRVDRWEQVLAGYPPGPRPSG